MLDREQYSSKPSRSRRAARRVRATLGRVLGVVCLVAIVLSGAVPADAAPADAAESGAFGWPLRPRPAVERRFDKPERNWLPGHRGVDLAGVAGQSVLAAGEGIVVFAGKVAGKPVVSVDHPGGLRTTYEPVEAKVEVGSRVSRGTPIGTLLAGHEGCPAAACLHWGARRETGAHNRREYVDPLGLLHEVPVRLKPLET
ncbi:M23 family metallopeptidase [Nocardia sp. NPDC058705]|uniref:M23 family metallopeptidase n=1 Tax=Nocardia sp. NPDC058705 TaxID=3346609 RepID=UPI0036ACA58C